MTVPLGLLQTWLKRQLAEPARVWFEDQMGHLSPSSTDRELYMALGMVPRKLGKDDLALLPSDLEQAGAAGPQQDRDPRGLIDGKPARIPTRPGCPSLFQI